jgi:DNA-binding transcriptional ArsR family regulator
VVTGAPEPTIGSSGHQGLSLALRGSRLLGRSTDRAVWRRSEAEAKLHRFGLDPGTTAASCEAIRGPDHGTRAMRCLLDHGTPASHKRLENNAPSGTAAVGLPLHVRPVRRILNHMVQYRQARLDDSFAALSDATRRGVLEQLGRSDASITDLAEKFHMTLTGMKKHVGVLEEAGLVTTEKVGRVRICKLGPRQLEEERAWLERYRQLWDSRFAELDKVVEELKRKEKIDGHKKRE